MDVDELREREKWTMFGNEAESVEVDVIRNQQMIRTRMDRMAVRQEVRCYRSPGMSQQLLGKLEEDKGHGVLHLCNAIRRITTSLSFGVLLFLLVISFL